MWEAFLCGVWRRVCVDCGRRFCVGMKRVSVCTGFRSKLCVVTWKVCMSAVCGVGYYIGNEHSSPERGGLDPSSLQGQTLPRTM